MKIALKNYAFTTIQKFGASKIFLFVLIFCKDTFNWSKGAVKLCIIFQKMSFQINAVLLIFIVIKSFWKKV